MSCFIRVRRERNLLCKILYSRAMKPAAMFPASFARESGYNEEENSWQVLVTISMHTITECALT